MEQWKDIKEFEGLYQVSNKGRVKSLSRTVNCNKGTRQLKEKILKHGFHIDGYLTVNLYKNGKMIAKCIHRLVAEAFIPNPNNLPEVNHIDEDKTNNNVDNLEWCTHEYNMNYGTIRERQQVGNKGRRQPVLQYSLDGDFIAEHESIKAAGRAIGKQHYCIRYNCIGQMKSAFGYIFKFKNEEVIADGNS